MDTPVEKSTRRSGLVIEHHPKSPEASLERLQALAGVITLKRQIMSTRFPEGDEAESPTERASD